MEEYWKYGLYAALVAAGIGLGFFIEWLRDRKRFAQAADASGLAQARHELESARAGQEFILLRLQSILASAAIDARRGEYEQARLAASSFFVNLQAEAGKTHDPVFTPAQHAELEPLSARRDDIIAELARNDPAASAQLADLFVSFRSIINPLQA